MPSSSPEPSQKVVTRDSSKDDPRIDFLWQMFAAGREPRALPERPKRDWVQGGFMVLVIGALLSLHRDIGAVQGGLASVQKQLDILTPRVGAAEAKAAEMSARLATLEEQLRLGLERAEERAQARQAETHRVLLELKSTLDRKRP
jgi:hypothetical protein